MDVQVITKQVTMYECPYCGQILATEKEVEKHKKIYDLCSNLLDAKPFRWYPTELTRMYFGNGTKDWKFIRHIELIGNRHPDFVDTCDELDYILLEFGKPSSYDYQLGRDKVYIYPEESLSVLEAYEKYGLIPTTCDNERAQWAHLPKQVLEDIKSCVRKEREKLLAKLRSLSHEELVQKIAKQEPEFSRYVLYEGETDETFEKRENDLDYLCASLNFYEEKETPKDTRVQRLLDETRKS